jgi:anhydro-N-acetylmuramic acid kinase
VKPSTDSRYFIGLMSGTSLDGIDCAIGRFTDGQLVETVATYFTPFEPALRDELAALQAPVADELHRVHLAANALAHAYAQAVAHALSQAALRAADICAIGAHGQTVRHRPELGYTVQLLNGALLAEETRISVVCDFRSRDIAAGGQGAPLVPAFHQAVFGRPNRTRVVVNIGGIANVSVLRGGLGSASLHNSLGDSEGNLVPDILHNALRNSAGESSPAQPHTDAPTRASVLGWDTGPGNVLMDLWASAHIGTPYDANGAWGAGGTVLPDLLAAMRAEPFFTLPPPKSTGRDLFNADWLARFDLRLNPANIADQASKQTAQNVQATLRELTAHTIADAIQQYAQDAHEVGVSGGGTRNSPLCAALQARLPGKAVASVSTWGCDADFVEALAFAWLAMRRVDGEPGNLPAVTGARGARVLGATHFPASIS